MGVLMKRTVFYPVLAIMLFLPLSCKFFSHGGTELLYRDNDVRKRASSCTEIASPSSVTDADTVYTVAVISDVHFGADKARTCDAQFRTWLAGLKTAGKLPRFVICLGDVAEHGHEDEEKQYRAFCNELETLYSADNLKVYTAIGNHDLYNSGWQYWKENVYPGTSFYHFRTNAFSWYFLDSANGSLGNTQVNILKSALDRDASPKIVCMHYPVYAQGHFYFCLQDTVERNLLISYFADGGVKLLLDGHTHMYNYTDFGKFVEFNVPGFLEDQQWALVTVNETAGTASASLVSGS